MDDPVGECLRPEDSCDDESGGIETANPRYPCSSEAVSETGGRPDLDSVERRQILKKQSRDPQDAKFDPRPR